MPDEARVIGLRQIFRDHGQRIVDIVRKADLSKPRQVARLCYLHINRCSSSFFLNKEHFFAYVGRTGYQSFKERVLSLRPVRQVTSSSFLAFSSSLCLRGTIGSGKSFMLAALACDLLSMFSDTYPNQLRRLVYVSAFSDFFLAEDCCAYAMREALLLAYFNDDDPERFARIESMTDLSSLSDFFKEEAERGVTIYFLIDNWNRIDYELDSGVPADGAVRSFLLGLSPQHVCVQCTTSSSLAPNLREEHHSKNSFWCIPGYDEEEYPVFKTHFSRHRGKLTPLGKLSKEEELKVKFETGCVPLFLDCWIRRNGSTASAWSLLCLSPFFGDGYYTLWKEVHMHLEDKLHVSSHFQFYSAVSEHEMCDIANPLVASHIEQGMRVAANPHGAAINVKSHGICSIANPGLYDSRFLYIDTEKGLCKCICGMYRKAIKLEVEDHFSEGHQIWRCSISGLLGLDDCSPAPILVNGDSTVVPWIAKYGGAFVI